MSTSSFSSSLPPTASGPARDAGPGAATPVRVRHIAHTLPGCDSADEQTRRKRACRLLGDGQTRLIGGEWWTTEEAVADYLANIAPRDGATRETYRERTRRVKQQQQTARAVLAADGIVY